MGRVVDVKTGRHGSIRQVIVQTLSDSKKQITKINRAPEKLVPILTEQVSEKQCIPLECGNEQVAYWKAQPSKYSKNEIRTFRKLKVYPPYTKSEQFKNPELENFGPEKEYVNTEKVIENEKRNWQFIPQILAENAVRLVLVNSAKKWTIFPRYTKLFLIYFHLIKLSGIFLYRIQIEILKCVGCP